MNGKLKNKRNFYLGIVLPSALAMLLFIASIYFFFIPFFKKTIMAEKKEMITELTNTAWSLINEYENDYAESSLSLQEAQYLAKKRIDKIRYGAELKDYFWIVNQQPVMIMHPYLPELIGQDMSNYRDIKGNKPFLEAINVVKKDGKGFIDYMWQRRDDSTIIAPKLSYVKLFEPWGWIIGTGIYIDDVEQEIENLKRSLLIISLVIALIISLILLYVVNQSLIIEKKREKLRAELYQSRLKYKTLVDASNEGILMFLNESIIFTNSNFASLTGFKHDEILKKKLSNLFTINWEQIQQKFADNQKSVSFETSLICADGMYKEIVLSASKVDYAGTFGYIFSPKLVSIKEVAQRETSRFSGEIKSSLLLMKQPVMHLIQPTITCSVDCSIQDAAGLMRQSKSDFLIVRQNDTLLGIVTADDISNRAVAGKSHLTNPVATIMSAPLITIPEIAPLYEVLLIFNAHKTTHLVTTDAVNSVTGVLSYKSVISIQHNTLSLLLHEIDNASTITELKQIHNRLPSTISVVVESNENSFSTMAFASSVSDKISRKLLNFAIEKFGTPPCSFVFIAMGSEGRREQTLLTDQDNAIIIEDGHTETLNYFLDVANFVNDALNEIGYNYCKGGSMACNPKWCQPLSVWKKYFYTWVTNPTIENMVEASTFLDFRAVYGNALLADQLRQHVFSVVRENNDFLVNLADLIANYKSPVNVFGNLVGNEIDSKDKTIDLKAIQMPIVKYCWVFALKYRIENNNSAERLKALCKQGKITYSLYKDLSVSFNYLMKLRLKNQVQMIQDGIQPSNTIQISGLSTIERSFLKSIFTMLNNISSSVVSEIKKSD